MRVTCGRTHTNSQRHDRVHTDWHKNIQICQCRLQIILADLDISLVLVSSGRLLLAESKFDKDTIEPEVGYDECRVGVILRREVDFLTPGDEIVHREERDIAPKRGRRVFWIRLESRCSQSAYIHTFGFFQHCQDNRQRGHFQLANVTASAQPTGELTSLRSSISLFTLHFNNLLQ